MHGRRVLLAGACLGGLLLAGCVSSSGSDYGAAGGGYPAPGYAVQGQPGVAAPGYGYPGGTGQGYGYPPAEAPGYGYAAGPPQGQSYVGPDGLSYVDSVPVGVVEGEQVPFVFVGGLGGWGYYDRERRWRGAPPEVRERLEQSHPGGRGLPPPYAERQHFERQDRARPEDRPFLGDRPGGPDRGGPGPGREGDRSQVERRALDRPVDRGPGLGFQPGGGRPEGGPDRFRPGGEPGRAGMENAGRPGGGEQAGRREGMFGGPGGQGQGRPGPGAPGPGGQPQGGQGRPATPPPKPAPPPAPRGCPPGQARC
jgi:hypothetical protein